MSMPKEGQAEPPCLSLRALAACQRRLDFWVGCFSEFRNSRQPNLLSTDANGHGKAQQTEGEAGRVDAGPACGVWIGAGCLQLFEMSLSAHDPEDDAATREAEGEHGGERSVPLRMHLILRLDRSFR